MKMKILHSLVLNALRPKALSFEKATHDPMKAQKNTLFEFIKRNKDTVYGREYSFGKINSIEEYQRRVPLNNYETLRPYIQRLVEGDKNTLTKDPPLLFGTTSGTTGIPKFIPVTEYSRKKKKEVMDAWLYYILRDHPGILKGQILAIVSPEVERCTQHGFPCGAETGHAYKNQHYIIRQFYVLPYPVFEIKSYDSKYYCILRIAMEKEVSTIATMNPSTIMLLCQRIDEYKESIIKDIEEGALSKDIDVKDDIRAAIEKTLRPNPERAAYLKKLLRDKGKLLPKDFWPGLALIECWKAGTVGMYLREFPKYFGNLPVRDFGYLSSEARCSIPMDDDKCCGVLAVNANFYEFVPREEKHKQHKKFLLCNELEVGQEYMVVLTTPGGLYRYDIDDVVKVTGFQNKTPRIEFLQKGLNVTSVTGEKLYESQVVQAIKSASDRSSVSMGFFTACIQWDTIPRYAFLVEFEDDTLDNNKKREFLQYIDEEIKSVNIEYASKRDSKRLAQPVLKVVKKGEFKRYRIKRVEDGMHDGQFKTPKLTRDHTFEKHFSIEEEIYLDK